MKKIQILSMLLIFLVTSCGTSQNNNYTTLNLEDGVAIKGYDPVAYFEEGKAVEGKEKLSTKFNGATYHFKSENNKEKFLKNPKMYEPQYGGWCAYAMGESGEKVQINPKFFEVKDGKLYLFYNTLLANTLKRWNEDRDNLKKKADVNWSNLK